MCGHIAYWGVGLGLSLNLPGRDGSSLLLCGHLGASGFRLPLRVLGRKRLLCLVRNHVRRNHIGRGRGRCRRWPHCRHGQDGSDCCRRQGSRDTAGGGAGLLGSRHALLPGGCTLLGSSRVLGSPGWRRRGSLLPPESCCRRWLGLLRLAQVGGLGGHFGGPTCRTFWPGGWSCFLPLSRRRTLKCLVRDGAGDAEWPGLAWGWPGTHHH